MRAIRLDIRDAGDIRGARGYAEPVEEPGEVGELEGAHARLRNEGYVVFPSLYSADFVAEARAGLGAIFEELGRPSLCQEGWNPQAIQGSGITSSGLQVGSVIADYAPDAVRALLHARIQSLFARVLGEDFEVDVIGGCVSDETRLRKPWHHHCGGPDENLEAPHFAPVGSAAKRLNLLVYLDDVGPEQGQLLVLPRAEDDPIEMSGPDRSDWAAQRVLSWTAGTAVVLDERTWHGVWPQSRPGLRMFVGGYFRAASLPAPKHADPRAAAMATDLR